LAITDVRVAVSNNQPSSANISVGDMYFNTNSDHFFVSDGSGMVSIDSAPAALQIDGDVKIKGKTLEEFIDERVEQRLKGLHLIYDESI